MNCEPTGADTTSEARPALPRPGHRHHRAQRWWVRHCNALALRLHGGGLGAPVVILWAVPSLRLCRQTAQRGEEFRHRGS